MMIVVKEASADWTTSNGAVATLLDEPKVSLLIDDDWALAKEEEINNEWALANEFDIYDDVDDIND